MKKGRLKGIAAIILAGVTSTIAVNLAVMILVTSLIVVGAASMYQVINYTDEEVASDDYSVKHEDGCSCGCMWIGTDGYTPSTGGTGDLTPNNGGGSSGSSKADGDEILGGLPKERSDNAKQAYKTLHELGYSDAAIYGILGNMWQESTFNPTLSGSYYGLVQINSGLKSDLVSWCSSNGYEYTSVEGQMRWLDYALTTGPEKNCFNTYVDDNYKISTDEFKKITDSKLACEYFMAAFERCIRSGAHKSDDCELTVKSGKYYQEGKKRIEYTDTVEKFFSSGTTNNNTGNGTGNTAGNGTSNTGNNTGSTGNIGNTTSDPLGRKIDNTIVPMYDGYTMNTAKYDYFDTDYSKFWNGTVDSSSPLYGLGDFANDKTNKVTYEGKNNLAAKSPAIQVEQHYCLIDGRIAFAAPPAIATTGDVLLEIQNQIKDISRYRYPTYNKDPKIINGNGNVPGYSGSVAVGLYFDIVLDDNTVIPAMIADTKGMHYGLYQSGGDGLWHDDTMSEGYCQMKWKVSNGGRGALSYKSILEAVGGDSNTFFSNDVLGGKKIVSVRTYKVQHNESSGYAKFFTEGGTDSSFATSGGVPGSNILNPGNGGSNGSGNDGRNPNDPNWQCSCSIPCPECDCHGEGSSGGISGEAGAAGGFTIVESEGTFQGAEFFTDINGNPYTSDTLWEIVESKAPGGKAIYAPFVGIDTNLVPRDTYGYTNDQWISKFTDGRGALMWNQGYNTSLAKNFGGLPLKIDRGLTRVEKNNTMSLGCGYFATAGIASTMLHRLITPAEISVNASIIRWDSNIDTSASGQNAMMPKGPHWILSRYKYKGENLFDTSRTDVAWKQSELDACLAAGGLVTIVVHTPSPWTGGGHWIVIRQKNADGTYNTMDGSRHAMKPEGNPNTNVTFAEIRSDITSVNYVYPGPAYSKYIADMTAKNSTNSSGGSKSEDNSAFEDWIEDTVNPATKWKQTDQRWGSDTMGESGITMASSGCFVTSLAIHIAMSDAYKDGVLASGFDPGTLNDYLGKNGGYSKKTNMLLGDGSWLKDVAPGFKFVTRIENSNNKVPLCDALDRESRKEFIKNELKPYRKKGYYIIFNIDYTGDYKVDHFVALKGIEPLTQDFKIADPGKSSLLDLMGTALYKDEISCNIMNVRVYEYNK